MNISTKIIPLINRYKFYSISLFIFLLYFFCMVFFPLYKGGYKWNYLHQVWFEWQTLNAAMIALLASAIAIYSTIYTQKKNKESNLIAAKARLPFALSSLMDYSTTLCKHYKLQYTNLKKGGKFNRSAVHADSVILDKSSIDIITECIKNAEKIEAYHLSKILNDLQVAHSRFQGNFSSGEHRIVIRSNVENELISIASIIHALEGAFDYARGKKIINYSSPEKEDIRKILLFRCKMEL